MDDAKSMKRRRLAALEQSMRVAAPPAPAAVEAPPAPAAPRPLLSAGGRGGAAPAAGRRPDAARGGRGGRGGGREGGRAAAAQPDVTVVDAAYAPLAPDVTAGPPGLARAPALGRPADWVHAELERLLRSHPKASSDAAALRAVIDGKLKHKFVLLDNPHAASATRDAPGASAAIAPLGRRSTAHGAADAPPSAVARAPAASARETRRLGLHAIPPEARRFELYAALHALWERHASAVLDSVAPGSSREAALAGLDLHGAMIKVVRASCPQRVGLEGLCLKHTAQMLYLLSPYDVLHAVPKRGIELAFAVGEWECRVEGSALSPPPPRPGAKRAKRGRQQSNAPRAVTRA